MGNQTNQNPDQDAQDPNSNDPGQGGQGQDPNRKDQGQGGQRQPGQEGGADKEGGAGGQQR